MQTIEIDKALYNKLIDCGINIQTELQKLADGFISDIKTPYKKSPQLTDTEIKKVVENSQRIEGYEPASKEYELEVESFMKEHNIEVSA